MSRKLKTSQLENRNTLHLKLKLLCAATALALAGTAQASNSVTVEQTGDNQTAYVEQTGVAETTAKVTQSGNGNAVIDPSSATAAGLYQSDMHFSQATVEQSGSLEHASVSQTTGIGTVANITQAGSLDNARIKQDNTDTSDAAIAQSGNRGSADISQYDGYHTAAIAQDAATAESTASITQRITDSYSGTNPLNRASVAQTGASKAEASINQDGAGHVVDIAQTGTSESSASADQTGRNGTASIVQTETHARFSTLTKTQAQISQNGEGNAAMIDQSYGFNSAGIVQGNLGGGTVDYNNALITQSGSEQEAVIWQTSDLNEALITQRGGFDTAEIVQSGAGNSATATQNGTGFGSAQSNTLSIYQESNRNVATVTQSGYANHADVTQH